MYIKSGALSDRDILKLMGKDIFIYPFNKNNLKGASYNLTASIMAYRIDTIIVTDENNKEYKIEVKKSLVNEDREIIIKSGITALIQTEESIYVSDRICGTYHSKVGLCNKGASHIGTTLDPCYLGTSLIAIHNETNEPIKIKVGDTFASLMFYTLKSKSKTRHNNLPFRADLEDLRIEHFDKEYLDKKLCVGIECENYKQCEGTKNICRNRIDKNYEEVKAKLLKEMQQWSKVEWRSDLEALKEIVIQDKVNRNEKRNMKSVETILSVVQIAITILLVICMMI